MQLAPEGSCKASSWPMSCGCKRLASSCAMLPVRAHWKVVPNRALVGIRLIGQAPFSCQIGFPPTLLLITSSSAGQIRLGPYGRDPGEASQALRPAIAAAGGALFSHSHICVTAVVKGLRGVERGGRQGSKKCPGETAFDATAGASHDGVSEAAARGRRRCRCACQGTTGTPRGDRGAEEAAEAVGECCCSPADVNIAGSVCSGSGSSSSGSGGICGSGSGDDAAAAPAKAPQAPPVAAAAQKRQRKPLPSNRPLAAS